jgi:hypothetical protein
VIDAAQEAAAMSESTSQEASQPVFTNTGLPELVEEIKACIAAGEEAQVQEEEAKAKRTAKFIKAGSLLIEARKRAPNFKAFLKEHWPGRSHSWAYKLIRMADGEVEVGKVRADAAKRKRRQRAKLNVCDKAHVTHTSPDARTTGTATETEASAEARKAAYAKAEAAPGIDPQVQVIDQAEVLRGVIDVQHVKRNIAALLEAANEPCRQEFRRELVAFLNDWQPETGIPDFLRRVA